MEKIRSGQSFLYRKEGLNCTVVDVRLKKKVRGDILNRALLEAIKRYPYLASKLVEKNGDFYIADNRDNSLVVRKTDRFHPLGSMSNSYHLIEITYYKEHIRVSFHHALCDGGGVKPFVESLLYYYFCILDSKEYVAPKVRKSTEPMFPDETAEPFDGKYSFAPYEKPEFLKSGFALPEYEDQIEDEDYRFETEIDAGDFMRLAKEVNATPATLLSYFISKSILLNNREIDKPIVCSMALDMRDGLGIPHTHKNCVGSVYLSFDEEDDKRELKDLFTGYRNSMAGQRQTDYVRDTANQYGGLNDKLDKLHGLEEKKKVMSFYDTMTINSYVLSYMGTFDLGECDSFIDAIHFYSGGIKGITVNMTAAGGKFNVTWIQNIETERYARTFIGLLEQFQIEYRQNEKIRFSTTKDATQRTARHQAERFRIRQ